MWTGLEVIGVLLTLAFIELETAVNCEYSYILKNAGRGMYFQWAYVTNIPCCCTFITASSVIRQIIGKING